MQTKEKRERRQRRVEKKRKAHKEGTQAGLDFSKPIDVTKFGTDEDPCFGKFHDNSAPECKRCGDSELCLIAKAQNLHIKRGKEELKTKFKDVNEPKHPELNEENLIKYIRVKKKKGYDIDKVIRLCKKKFLPYVSLFQIKTISKHEYGK